MNRTSDFIFTSVESFLRHFFSRSQGNKHFRRLLYTVGIVPPSMTYSLPVMEEAWSDARNATSSATSSGRFGLPSGMPPSESMMRCLAASLLIPVRCAISFTIPCTAAWRRRTAYVVDQDVEAAETIHNRLDDLIDSFARTDVCLDEPIRRAAGGQ